MSTEYPQAYYVNILDGVPGKLRFVSTTTDTKFVPVLGSNVTPVVTFDPSQSGGAVEVVKAAPSGSSASWQNCIAPTFENGELAFSFNGVLPAMSGVQPCGFMLRTHPWQVEVVSGSDVQAFSFLNVNDGQNNTYPLYFVPFFGNYDLTNGLTVALTAGGLGTAAYTDAYLEVTLPKPLNPQQTGQLSWAFNTSDSVPGASPAPASLLTAIRNSTVTQRLSGGQITGFSIKIPFSQMTPGSITPGTDYALSFAATQQLTCLVDQSYTNRSVVVCSASTLVRVAGTVTAPTVTNVVLSADPAEGFVAASPTDGKPCYAGKLKVTYTAVSPMGVAGPKLSLPGGQTLNYVYSIATGPDTYVAKFDLDSIPGGFGLCVPQLQVPTLGASPKWASVPALPPDATSIRVADTSRSFIASTGANFLAGVMGAPPVPVMTPDEQNLWSVGHLSYDGYMSSWQSGDSVSGWGGTISTSSYDPPDPYGAYVRIKGRYFYCGAPHAGENGPTVGYMGNVRDSIDNSYTSGDETYTDVRGFANAVLYLVNAPNLFTLGLGLGDTVTYVKVP